MKFPSLLKTEPNMINNNYGLIGMKDIKSNFSKVMKQKINLKKRRSLFNFDSTEIFDSAPPAVDDLPEESYPIDNPYIRIKKKKHIEETFNPHIKQKYIKKKEEITNPYREVKSIDKIEEKYYQELNSKSSSLLTSKGLSPLNSKGLSPLTSKCLSPLASKSLSPLTLNKLKNIQNSPKSRHSLYKFNLGDLYEGPPNEEPINLKLQESPHQIVQRQLEIKTKAILPHVTPTKPTPQIPSRSATPVPVNHLGGGSSANRPSYNFSSMPQSPAGSSGGNSPRATPTLPRAQTPPRYVIPGTILCQGGSLEATIPSVKSPLTQDTAAPNNLESDVPQLPTPETTPEPEVISAPRRSNRASQSIVPKPPVPTQVTTLEPVPHHDDRSEETHLTLNSQPLHNLADHNRGSSPLVTPKLPTGHKLPRRSILKNFPHHGGEPNTPLPHGPVALNMSLDVSQEPTLDPAPNPTVVPSARRSIITTRPVLSTSQASPLGKTPGSVPHHHKGPRSTLQSLKSLLPLSRVAPKRLKSSRKSFKLRTRQQLSTRRETRGSVLPTVLSQMKPSQASLFNQPKVQQSPMVQQSPIIQQFPKVQQFPKSPVQISPKKSLRKRQMSKRWSLLPKRSRRTLRPSVHLINYIKTTVEGS